MRTWNNGVGPTYINPFKAIAALAALPAENGRVARTDVEAMLREMEYAQYDRNVRPAVTRAYERAEAFDAWVRRLTFGRIRYCGQGFTPTR